MRATGLELLVFTLIFLSTLLNVAVYGGFIAAYDPAGGAPNAEQRDSRREAAARAERDDSDGLPGRFVATQGRQHTDAWPLDASTRIPFCQDGEIVDTCYASNPPTSGYHVPVARNVLVDGAIINLPPEPGIYAVEIPREAIPHLQEHAGVYAGYNCGSEACDAAVEQMRTLVKQELSLGARVIMSPDSDLAEDTIGLASWTRFDTFDAEQYTDGRARSFIKAHSCRFDPEGFCAERPAIDPDQETTLPGEPSATGHSGRPVADSGLISLP